MNVETKMTIEVEVTVRGTYRSPDPGALSGPMARPPVDEHIEDFEVEFPNATKWLPEYDDGQEDLIAALEAELLEAVEDHRQAAAEARYDERRDDALMEDTP